jgi:hypothetical protein
MVESSESRYLPHYRSTEILLKPQRGNKCRVQKECEPKDALSWFFLLVTTDETYGAARSVQSVVNVKNRKISDKLVQFTNPKKTQLW